MKKKTALKKHSPCDFFPPNTYNPYAWIIGNPKIGAKTWIGAFCLIDGMGGLEIGKGCDISCGAHILTHSTVRRCLSERRYDKVDKTPTKIGDHVFIGENATILMGAEIGHHCVIGAGAVVKEHSKIPPYSLVVGVPGKIVRNLKAEADKLKENGTAPAKKKTSSKKKQYSEISA